MREYIARQIEKRWYGKPGCLLALFPLECLFGVISQRRKRKHQASSHESQALLFRDTHRIPLVVVGNISVGGTGKTPTLISLVRYFQSRGYRPGVVSRGYGRATETTQLANADSSVSDLGDEPYLIYNTTHCHVAVSSRRNEAISLLATETDCDLIFSDDGLQHYQMHRDVEIVVVDQHRGFGNGHLLPVGPLREPESRLTSVDWVLINNSNSQSALPDQAVTYFNKIVNIQLRASGITQLSSQKKISFTKAEQWPRLVAVAGIGNPQRFFDTLCTLGLTFEAHSFPDHYLFSKEDFTQFDERKVIMTMKDAVKCKAFASENWYVLEVDMHIDEDWLDKLEKTIYSIKIHSKSVTS